MYEENVNVSYLEMSSHHTFSRRCESSQKNFMNGDNYVPHSSQENKDLGNSSNSSAKQRRPDMALYVPRARRLKVNNGKSVPPNKESYCKKKANTKFSKQAIAGDESPKTSSIGNSHDNQLFDSLACEVSNSTDNLIVLRDEDISQSVVKEFEFSKEWNFISESEEPKNINKLLNSAFDDGIHLGDMEDNFVDTNNKAMDKPIISTPMVAAQKIPLGNISIPSEIRSKSSNGKELNESILNVVHTGKKCFENESYVPLQCSNYIARELSSPNSSFEIDVSCISSEAYMGDHVTSSLKTVTQLTAECSESSIVCKSICNGENLDCSNDLPCYGVDQRENLCESSQMHSTFGESAEHDDVIQGIENANEFRFNTPNVLKSGNDIVLDAVSSIRYSLLTEDKPENISKPLEIITHNVQNDNDLCVNADTSQQCSVNSESLEEPQLYFSELTSNDMKSDQFSDGSDCSRTEDSWDTMFDDSGECLNPDVIKELIDAVGNVKVSTSQKKYSEFQPHESTIDEEYGHIVELYGFPPEFNTQDLVSAFSLFRAQDFTIKWVDDCHALGVFASPFVATEALTLNHPCVKVRPLSQGIRESKLKAKRLNEQNGPLRPRPATSATLARRLVSGALGLKINISKEQRDSERQAIKEARERKKQVAKQRQDVWNGIVS